MARSSSRWPQTFTLILLSGMGLVGGCQKIFGEFEIVEEPPPAPAPTTLCALGDLRCAGPFLYTCGPDENSWVEQETCLTARHCNSRDGGCRSCVPGDHRCDGSRLELCGDSGWTLVEDCGDPNACNLNSDSCRPCTRDEYQCQGKTLMLCSAEQTWTLVAECSGEAACSVASDKRSGACAAVDERCTASGKHVCEDGVLKRCTESRDELVVVDQCERDDLCDAAAADRQAQDGKVGTCLTACEPDAVRCAGAEFQRCSGAGLWDTVMACDSPAACSAKPGSAGCSPCAPGALECNDGELRRCAPDSPNGWELVRDCGAAHLCNEGAGACEAGFCPVAGQTRCAAVMERCVSDQSHWDPIGLCEGDLCNAHDMQCDTPTCQENTKRCWEGTLQECKDSLRSWDTIEICDADETCSLEGCTRDACGEGEYRCNDVYLETCNAASWQRVERCTTHGLCDAEGQRCKAPACAVNEAECVGNSSRQCKSDQTGWVELGDCAPQVCHEASGKCR